MSKDAYYFSHDAGARNDPKISAMRMEYKSEGYGWFWIIIEVLREQEDYRLSCKDYMWNALAMQMQCTKEVCISYVNSCINQYELFESDGDYFWSNSLIKRMESRNSLSEKRRESANKRWGNANAMQVDANAMQTDARKGKEKEKKENENKGKNINKNPLTPLQGEDISQKKNEDVLEVFIGPSFSDFWEAYDYSIAKPKCERVWLRMSIKNREAVIEYLKDYIPRTIKKEDGSGRRYRKHPLTFLNGKGWEDELPPIETEKQNSKNYGYGKPRGNQFDPEKSLAAARAMWGNR